MKTSFRVIAGSAALLALVAVGNAQANPPQSLQTEGTGTVTVTSGSSVRIVNDANEYGAAYTKSNLIKYEKNKPSTRLIGQVDYSFSSSGSVAGGAPRFSIPIDINDDGSVDGYAFLDVNGCNSTTVSTESSTCTVFFNSEVFSNWDAFVAAHPTYTVASVPFIIADQPGDYFIYDIDVK